VTALVRKRPFEITTLRRDVETDGRHAIVAFTADWRQDASRRDFTMNALYADRDGRIDDFFGGIADARAGRVRFIGDPALRIAEDGLRILRFFRFHAWYGIGDPDPGGLAACAAGADMIDRLSGDRVRDEVLKLLRAPDPVAVWQAMIDAGIVARVAPAAIRTGDLARLIAAETAAGVGVRALRRLAALVDALHHDRSAALKAGLKLSNADTDYLAALPRLATRLGAVESGGFAHAAYGVQPDWLLDTVLLAGLPAGPLRRFLETWQAPRFPLSGADLMARGMQPGPEIGARLKQVEDWWLEGGLAATREQCLAELDRLVPSPQRGEGLK
jgi:poly(A) polymerase